MHAADAALADRRARCSASARRRAAWFHYPALTAALLGDVDARDRRCSTKACRRIRTPRALLNNLAAVLERRGRLDDARATAERGVHEDAGLAQLHKNLGDLHYRAGRYDDALEAYLRAREGDPDLGADVYLKLGNIRLRRQERDEAVRCWERALALDPGQRDRPHESRVGPTGSP